MYRDKQFSPFVIGPCPAGIKTPSTNEQAVTRAIIRRPHNVLHRAPVCVCVCVFFPRSYYLCVSSTNLSRCPPNLFLPLPFPYHLTRNTHLCGQMRATRFVPGPVRLVGDFWWFFFIDRKNPRSNASTESEIKTLLNTGKLKEIQNSTSPESNIRDLYGNGRVDTRRMGQRVTRRPSAF